MRAVIVGAGALGREVHEYATANRQCILQFVDHHLAGDFVKVRGRLERILHPDDVDPGINHWLAIANPRDREVTAERLAGRTLGKMMLGWVAHDVDIGEGAIMLPGSLMSVGSRCGRGLVVNVKSTIGHDVSLGHFVTISSQVDICGRVTIGDRVFIGSGARILPEVTIGSDAVVGAGAVVMGNVAAGKTVFAMPARQL